ncbi:NADP-dependent oxidoreductase [Rhodococcus tibetensis]|uniref:NADP-dependent oxidoreductase n=1 Tax=Rhodococcus tibetensis TaxID=2965064 RepID=A0ABT1QHM8_9NOCA|nr:NADP-dependent oxidoreductase [Rhodococcus sp. FXJ9.536]MCQ4121793.1 NADP-dependent oxidoreductase [Rhodococcus sp. FXJ9.536]
MRAIVTTGAEDLKTIEVAVPNAGPGEIRIELRAAAVNPVDSQTRRGNYHRLGWIDQPDGAGLGWDVAGIVDALGDGVAGPVVGARVVALHDRLDAPLRAFADYVVVPATAVAHIPDGLDFVGAATLPLNLSTADQALDLLGDPTGRTLLVTGAAGGVGGFAVPLAVARGWTVSALGRPTDTDFLVSAGAVEVLGELPSTRFDAVFDAAVLGEAAVVAVVDGGTYVGVVPPAMPEAVRGIDVQAVMVHHDGARLEKLLRSVARTGNEKEPLAARIAGTYPLTRADEAVAALDAGGSRGRWVLTFER